MMFRRAKYEQIETDGQTVSEIMGLRECISVDDIRAHLVDTLEESRRLKKENEELRETGKRERDKESKKYTVALVEISEWKKREKEARDKIKELETEIKELNRGMDRLKIERNRVITEMELAQKDIKKAKNILEEREERKGRMEALFGNTKSWEKMTKMELIKLIKAAMDGEETMEYM